MASPKLPWISRFHETRNVLISHVDLTFRSGRENRAVSWLDDDEQDRWRRYRRNTPRYEFALCRAALRSILCSNFDCHNDELTFGKGKHGKPFALNQGGRTSFSFNVSHSGRHGLIAIAPRGELGIDVEERRQGIDVDGIGRMVFSPWERKKLSLSNDNDKQRLFFMLWTLKEALIKGIGTGFSLSPARFEVPQAMLHGAKTGTFSFAHFPAVTWNLENLDNDDFAATLASQSNTDVMHSSTH